MLDLPFDPLKRARDLKELVMKGLARKYYRFRPARYYGGIATADIVGCPFLCAYCWNYGRNLHPEMSRDRYYSPHEVANRLLSVVKRRGFNKVRLSGAEPILGEQSFEHLYQVLRDIYRTNPGLHQPASRYDPVGSVKTKALPQTILPASVAAILSPNVCIVKNFGNLA